MYNLIKKHWSSPKVSYSKDSSTGGGVFGYSSMSIISPYEHFKEVDANANPLLKIVTNSSILIFSKFKFTILIFLNVLLFIRLLIKWFRFHTFFGFTLTAVLWMFLCYQVLTRSGTRDEDNAFNLIEDVIIDDIKEVPIFF